MSVTPPPLPRTTDRVVNDNHDTAGAADRFSWLLLYFQVVFDRFDSGGMGFLSAADARAALEYMGRDVATEACASWLADKEREQRSGGGTSFVDFTTA